MVASADATPQKHVVPLVTKGVFSFWTVLGLIGGVAAAIIPKEMSLDRRAALATGVTVLGAGLGVFMQSTMNDLMVTKDDPDIEDIKGSKWKGQIAGLALIAGGAIGAAIARRGAK
jgi:hypothetical protein